jgi:DNA-damage-inducible protein J
MKTEVINARVEPALKSSAEKIFKSLGMTTTGAISIFLRQVVLKRGLPFSVKTPNKTTSRAMQDIKTGKGKRYKTVQALLNDAAK